MPDFDPEFKSSRRPCRLGGSMIFLAGVLCGAVFSRFLSTSPLAVPSSPGVQSPTANRSRVTWENYTRIKRGMDSWDVQDLLGSGQVVAESSYTVDENGHFRKYTRGQGSEQEETGQATKHDGKAVAESKRVVRWSDGQGHIEVTFSNDQVVSKLENGLQ